MLKNVSYIIDKAGIISGIRQVPSPNCDVRPVEGDINTLVIHAISLPPDQFGGDHICALFTNQLDIDADPYFKEINHLHVSSHFLIDRKGKITQFVPVYMRAWHAGESEFDGRKQVNDFSIGIELEGCDTKPFELEQYIELSKLTHSIQATFPEILTNRIIGHSDIAPGRKTDPGPFFQWEHYRELLQELKTEQSSSQIENETLSIKHNN